MALRFSAAAAPDVGHGRPNLIRRVLITLPLSPMLAELTNECFLPAEPSQLAPVNCRRGAGAGFPVGRSERPDRVEPPRSEATGRRSGSGVFAASAFRTDCSSLRHVVGSWSQRATSPSSCGPLLKDDQLGCLRCGLPDRLRPPPIEQPSAVGDRHDDEDLVPAAARRRSRP